MADHPLSNRLIRINNFTIELDDSNDLIKQNIAEALKIRTGQINNWEIVRKAVDARKKSHIHFVCTIECELADDATPKLSAQAQAIEHSRLNVPKPDALRLSQQEQNRVVVVGSGPAGLFAALALIDAGVPVTLLERGKPIETRMRDIGKLRSRGKLNPESNICFGEGGAGTYTDGKLYTRIKHPFVRWVLAQFVRFGADQNILIDAHPHLGTDRLVRIIRTMREHLIASGVDYRFETRVDALLTENGNITGVRCSSEKGADEEISASRVVLAIGHSARDTFEHLQSIGIAWRPKSLLSVFVPNIHRRGWINVSSALKRTPHPWVLPNIV